jgi:hypothetical protein
MSKTVAGELLEPVVLVQSHTHEGVDYIVGDTIHVTKSEKAWLIENNIIEV